ARPRSQPASRRTTRRADLAAGHELRLEIPASRRIGRSSAAQGVDHRAGVEAGQARPLELDRRTVGVDQLEHADVEPLVHLHLERFPVDGEDRPGGNPAALPALRVEAVHLCRRDGDHAPLGRGRGGVVGLHPGKRAPGSPDPAADELVTDEPAGERASEVSARQKDRRGLHALVYAASLEGSLRPAHHLLLVHDPSPTRCPRAASSRSRNGVCAAFSRVRASSIPNHSTRSISGNTAVRPDRGGHSISNVLLTAVAGSRSPSTAQPNTTLPDFWRISPSSICGPSGTRWPVSSANSRRATAATSSPGSTSPFGIVQWPWSFLTQMGPPLCARSTSSAPPRSRHRRMPALVRPDLSLAIGSLNVPAWKPRAERSGRALNRARPPAVAWPR